MRPRLSVQHAERTERGVVAIAYVRVSTDKQVDDGVSMEAQEQKMIAECARRGIADVRVIVEAGMSGARRDRPKLTEALRLLQVGEANLLMITDLDRLARSTSHMLEIAETAQAQGWDIVAMNGALTIDTTSPVGKLMLTTLSACAEFERAMTRQRTLSAMQYKRSQAEPGLISNPSEDRIQALFAEHYSMQGIADKLTEEGIPTAKGGIWNASTVRRVLVRRGLAREISKGKRKKAIAV